MECRNIIILVKSLVFFSFFTFNLLVVNFALLKLKKIVPNKSSWVLGGFSAGGYSPRGLTVAGFITKRKKERKKERNRKL